MITMAPSLLIASAGIRQFALFGSTQSFDNTNPKQATIPAETKSGDLLLMLVASESPLSVPSGWTTLIIDSAGVEWMVISKTAGPSDAGSTFTYGTDNNDSSAVVAVFGSAATSVFGGSYSSGGDTGETTHSITTLNVNDIVIAWGATKAEEHALTLATAGFTEISAVASASGFSAAVGLHYKVQASAGATGTVDFSSGGDGRTAVGLMSITSTL